MNIGFNTYISNFLAGPEGFGKKPSENRLKESSVVKQRQIRRDENPVSLKDN